MWSSRLTCLRPDATLTHAKFDVMEEFAASTADLLALLLWLTCQEAAEAQT